MYDCWRLQRVLAWQKGISAGLWVHFEKTWLDFWFATCSHLGGHRRDLYFVASLLLLLFSLVKFSLIGGLLLTLLLGLFLIAVGGLVGLLSWFRVLPFGLPHGCLPLIRVGGLSRLRFGMFGRFMVIVFSSFLGKTLSG